MPRSNIHYEEKRESLAREVFHIFMENGYENTTLSLLVKELKISKGALYHYFTTKEACADAAVALCAKDCYEKVACRIDENSSTKENFKNLVLYCSLLFQDNEKNMENINTPSNAIFHQKLMSALVTSIAPLYAKVIEQGVRENIFTSEYPLETAEMILTLTNFYLDSDLFGWESDEIYMKLRALENLLTNALHAESGFFSFFLNFN